MAQLETKNINNDLWFSIEKVLGTIQNTYSEPFNKETSFKNFFLTDYCYVEDPFFINIGEYSFTKSIKYSEDRNSSNTKSWNKEKAAIESDFRLLFPKFSVPEQSFKQSTNPLLGKEQPAILNIDDQVSEKFSYEKICKLFGVEEQENEFSNSISFQFFINKKETELENPVSVGINEIGYNTGFITIEVKVFIRNKLEYCLETINSKVFSPVLFTKYLNSQLFAYLGYNEYPIQVINNMRGEEYTFSKNILIPGKYVVSYPTGQIYYVQKPNMEYQDYVLQSNTLYDSTEKKIKGEVFDLDVLKNKILSVDSICSQIIYTDSFGNVEKLDLTGFEYLSEKHVEYLKHMSVNSEEVQKCFSLCKKILSEIDVNSASGFTKIEGIRDIEVREITEDKYPEEFKLLQKCYVYWDSSNIDVLMKLKLKVYLDCIMHFNKQREFSKIEQERREGYVSIERFNKFPISLVKLIKENKFPERNRLMNFPEVFRDEYFLREISNLQSNNEVKRPAIITYQTLEVANRINYLTRSLYNTLILDNLTIKGLFETFGNKLDQYFAKLPENTLLIIHPNIFFEGDFLGNPNLMLANKLSKRFLMVELLKSIGFDYIVFYKKNKLDLKDLLPTSLRQLFEGIKYRIIYGNININDSLVLDPNTNLTGEGNVTDLKENAYVTKEEAEYNCFIYNGSNKDTLYAIPKIEQYIHRINISKDVEEFYRDLVSIGFQNIKNNPDFSDAVLLSDLDNKEELMKYYSDYLSQADIFLNAPDSNLFIYKEKFENQTNNDNLVSAKIPQILNIVASALYGGEIQSQVRTEAKYGKPLIIVENREVRDHIARELRKGLPASTELVIFNTVNEDEIKKFNSSKCVGIITRDLLNINPVLKAVSTYIVVQNEWGKNYLENILDCVLFQTINGYGMPLLKVDNEFQLLGENIDVHFLVFNNTLEMNKLYNMIQLYTKDKIKLYSEENSFKNVRNYLTEVNYIEEVNTEDLETLTSEEFNKSNIMGLYRKIKDYEYNQAMAHKQFLSNLILKKLQYRLPEKDLLSLAFDRETVESKDFGFGGKTYIPFLNGMYLDAIDKFSLIQARVDEHFSDINGNEIKYNNAVVVRGKPVYTAFGTGYVKDITQENAVVDIIGFQEVLVAINNLFIGTNSIFEEYARSLGNYGDCKLSKDDVKISVIKEEDKDIRLDVANNTVELKCGIINGLFSIYTNNIDADNVRLENYNFDRFSNIFAVDIDSKETFEDVIERLRGYDVNNKYIGAINQCYREFSKGNKFIVPEYYNYFKSGQMKEKNPVAYPTIWNDKFFIFINGNFYQKLGYKLSRKFNVNLIKSTYIEQFERLKDCRFELIKISKMLNILNLQTLLGFFENTYEKMEVLNISEPNSIDSQIATKQDLLIAIREKERKLKQRIKTLRSEKYGK